MKKRDGEVCEFNLRHVDLDGQELVGTGRWGATIVIPLAEVDMVWRRTRRAPRFTALWAAAALTGSLAGLGLAPLIDPLSRSDGLLLGALAGSVIAALSSWVLQNRPAMNRWSLLYGGPEA